MIEKVLKHISYQQVILLLLFVCAVFFTRFYNLDHTARFTRDESSDLARMQQYYNQRKITLVGPIDSENIKVFSSLTYYMVMPFAAAAHFEPVGPVYGMAFYGVLTVPLLLAITWKVRKDWLPAVAVLLVVWYPLLEMSRWAWNPHLVVFWGGIGVLSYLLREKKPYVAYSITGISLGMMFHHHYLALFATGPFVLYAAVDSVRKKQYLHALLLLGGYSIPHLVFLAFDLRHPPGLFFGKYLQSGSKPNMDEELTLVTMLGHLGRNYRVFLESITRVTLVQYIVGLLVPVLLFFDIKSKKLPRIIWFIPVITAILIGVVLGNFEVRYVYPALIFFFVWILIKRSEQKAKTTAQVLFAAVLLGSLLTVYAQLTTTLVHPDMYSASRMSKYVQQTIATGNAPNANVATLGSPDKAPLGEIYRDLIPMDGTPLRAASEYDASENLFIFSTKSFETVLEHEAYALHAFKDGHLKDTYYVPHSEWRVYWVGY